MFIHTGIDVSDGQLSKKLKFETKCDKNNSAQFIVGVTVSNSSFSLVLFLF